MIESKTSIVPRETCPPKTVLALLEKEPEFIDVFRLMDFRSTLTFNTANHSYILFLAAAAKRRGYLPLVLFEFDADAESFYSDATALFDSEKTAWIPLFPGGPALNNPALLENHVNFFLRRLYDNDLELIIASENIFAQRVAERVALESGSLYLNGGKDFAFSDLLKRLAEMGYQRNGIVEFCGDFAVRGGIVDVYPFGETYPLRLEFFGDTVESIRRFNPHDQISFENCTEARVLPSSHSASGYSTVRDVLPENILLIRIADLHRRGTAPAADPALPFKQWIFDPALTRTDLNVPLQSTPPPRDPRDTHYWNEIRKQNRRIFVFAEHELLRESIHSFLGEAAEYVPANLRFGFHFRGTSLLLLSAREIFQKEYYLNPDKRFIPEYARRPEAADALRYGDAVVHVDHGIGIYRGIAMLEFRGVQQEAMVVEYQNKDKIYVPIRQMNKIFRYSGETGKALKIDRIGTAAWEQAKHHSRKYIRKAATDLVALYADRKTLPGFAFEKDTPDALRLEADFPYTETPDQLQSIDDIRRDMEKPVIMDRLVCGDVGFGKTEVAIRAAFKAVYSGKQVAVLVPTTLLCFQHDESFRERLTPYGIHITSLNRFIGSRMVKQTQEDMRSGKTDIVIGTHKLLSNILFFKDLGLLVVDEEHRFGVNHKETIRNLKRRVDVLTLTATPIPRTLQLALAGLRDISKIETPPRERLPIVTRIMYWNNADIKAAIERELDRNGQVFILNNHIGELPALQKTVAEMFPSRGVRFAHGQMPGTELEKTMMDFYHHKFDILITTTIIESGIDIPNANTLIVINAQRFGLSQLYQIRGRVGRSYKKAFAYLIIPRGRSLSPLAMKRLQTLEYYTDLGSGYHVAMRDLEIRGAGDLFGIEQSGHLNRLGYAYFNRMFEEELQKARDPEKREHDSADIRLEHPAYLPEYYIAERDIRIAFYRELSGILSGEMPLAAALNAIGHIESACRDRFGRLPQEAVNLFNDARLSVWLKGFEIDALIRKDGELRLLFSPDAGTEKIQRAAGKLLGIFRKHHIEISFVSKQHLFARTDENFLSAFYAGTFLGEMDSIPG
ncbi:MAG: transcription-repair coupling factor [Candidatus Marinimicrobia bacterium]|nr:transcription-repair coupling factor [Candidatus Neomarinimicrobiota bacterium]